MLELSARLQKTLENQSANLQANFGLEGILSKHFFCSEKSFKVGNALSLLTVNCKRSLPTLSREFWTCHYAQPSRTRKNYANREMHKKPVRKPQKDNKKAKVALQMTRKVKFTFQTLNNNRPCFRLFSSELP